MTQASDPSAHDPARISPPELPLGVELQRSDSELDILLRWNTVVGTPIFRFFTFFTIFWNAIVALFVVIMIVVEEFAALLFMSIFIIVGVGLIYYQIAQLWNSTRIHVQRGLITIDHGPLPMPTKKDRTLKSEEIGQMYVTEYEFGQMNGVPQMACKLIIAKKDGTEITLLDGQEHEPLYFMEKQIEHFLGIKDRRMDGELTT